MSMDIKVVTIPFPDPGGADTLLVYKAPSANYGGGQRLLDAYFVNHAATGGTTFTCALHKFSNAGTPAVNGTIAAAIGGTAAPWADSVPKQFTLDQDYAFLDAGEWVAVVYAEVNAGNPTNGELILHVMNGK